MCLLFSTDYFETKDTLLIVAPICTPPGEPQAWQLTYINSITPKNGATFTSFSSSPPLMVVPIPNPHHLEERDFLLFDVDKTAANSLRNAAEGLVEPYAPALPSYAPPPNASLFGSAAAASLAPLAVQNVGSYRITVAPSFEDLRTRAPWERFSIPPTTVANILGDIHTRFATTSTAFIIAEGNSNAGLKSAGFSIQYRSARPNAAFFPTSHEPPSASNGAVTASQTALVQLDVTLVALNAILRPFSLLSSSENVVPNADLQLPYVQGLGGKPSVVLRADDTQCRLISPKWTAVSQLMKALPIRPCGFFGDKSAISLERVRLVTLWKLNGLFANRDVVARKATVEDIAVAERMYDDMSAWLQYREQFPRAEEKQHKSGFGFSSVYQRQVRKLDYVLALLARQLSDPGVNDRVSDVACRATGEKMMCGPLSYVNLDISNLDLDEPSYEEKDGHARFVTVQGSSTPVDTAGTTYLRVGAKLGAYESLEQRTVRWKSNT